MIEKDFYFSKENAFLPFILLLINTKEDAKKLNINWVFSIQIFKFNFEIVSIYEKK